MSQHARGRAAAQPVPPFPLLTAMEVMDCLHALGVNAQMEDLTKPTASTTQHVYAQLLDALMAAPMEAIEGPKAALLGMMEYKELYNDALHFTMFYRHCRTLAELCGIMDFAMSDLTRPDAQRFRICLSGIMNFAKFRDERMQFQNQLQAEVQEQSDRLTGLRQKLDQVGAQIEEIKARNAAEQPQFEQAQKRNDGLRNELLDLRGQQVKLSQEVEELKRERQGLMDQAAHNAHLNTQLNQQILSTKSRLVQSPDRIKRQISEMHSAVTHEKSKLASFQVKARELTNRLEVIGSLENDLKGLIDLEKGILEQKGKVEEHRRSKALLESRKEGKEIELGSMVERAKQLQTQLTNAQDKLARQKVMMDEMQQKGMKRIEELKADYKVRTKERGEWQKQRDVLIAEQKELESEMTAFITTHDNEINGMLEEYWNMRRQAEEYMNTMTVKLGLRLRV
ncbi:hypothetical protein IAU59_002713 [Kwoniella sp. CBS 9459]